MNTSTDQPNPPAPPQTQVTLDDRTLSIIAHVGGLLTSFVVPLVIWLVQQDKDVPSKKHALEALNFQVTITIAIFVSFFLSFVFIGFLLMPVLMILDVIFCTKAAIAASNNQFYTYPMTIRFFK